MNLDYQVMINQFSQIIWPLPRITALLLSIPLISSGMVSARIRMLLALSMAFLVSPLISTQLSLLHFSGQHIVIVLFESLLGLLMGFALQLVFQVFIIGGQIIAMQAGLGFATMVDPASKASVPLVSQLYLMMMSLMFFVLNGHLAVFEMLLGSFQKMPVGSVSLSLQDIGSLIMFSGWMFKEAVLVALPAILSLLIVSLSFGIMTRVAPQLNIFSIGFPITLLMGIVIVRVSLPGVSSQIADSLEQGLLFIKGLLR
ncbi:flagellar biosynthetic protein FliR [Legionella spiritensis]|uniref:Flagellar biosynthetic protein FliR n=1 Tax=Legionella spiritensis TaxID=452 RepID=A0A0W0Z984_LEGSP|nr:flagellar biosynthetic protein FliR [Legionella spiritensis]KTD65675.1 flagellar biosynthetic protein fliR [Legionella spiritensis]SNV43592.1 flagellar biosynthetic protein FliR [Legionella spiritensis]VEG90666.1 flagellar biosynthetic protein FliR [Legionella spiritensis]